MKVRKHGQRDIARSVAVAAGSREVAARTGVIGEVDEELHVKRQRPERVEPEFAERRIAIHLLIVILHRVERLPIRRQRNPRATTGLPRVFAEERLRDKLWVELSEGAEYRESSRGDKARLEISGAKLPPELERLLDACLMEHE